MNKKIKILEVNNIDLPGRRFNGYDIQNYVNKNTGSSAKQIVVLKLSNDKKVVRFFDSVLNIALSNKLGLLEKERLSVHSQLSLTSPALKENKDFKSADLVHYHFIHNTKLSLYSLIELMNEKPTVISIHDPWTFTGRCVHPGECNGWKTGCKKCDYLDTVFPMTEDNCKYLWDVKKEVYQNIDPDIIVSTQYMYDLLKASPLTKHINNVHMLPLGLDLNDFSNRIDKKEAREKLSINEKDIVLFFRAQKEFKGTNYIVEALDKLKLKKKVTLLTCDQIGLLDSIKDQYNVVDLGIISNDEMINAYNACDIFLMPSIGESFGMMAVEAMACEKPVIVFDNTALPSVTFAPECGVLVENKNSKKLGEAIKYLVENEKERIKRGKLGRKLAEENYDENIHHQKMMDIYEKAYNRQKNNIQPEIYYDVDFSEVNVQKVLPKLKAIAEELIPNKLTDMTIFDNIDSDFILDEQPIDFAERNVQNLFMTFNEELYSLLDKRESYIKRKISRLKYFKDLFLHDRSKFKERVSNRLRKYKIIHWPLKMSYKVLRKAKNLILRGTRTRQNVNYLLNQNYILSNQIDNDRETLLEKINLLNDSANNTEESIKYINQSLANNQKQIFYYHGGSGNHGCEALIRTIVDINKFKAEENCLYSYRPEEDYKFKINDIVKYIKLSHLDTKEIDNDYFSDGALALSIGGDNYCGYPDGTKRLAEYNKKFNDRGVITALVGCSIEPDILEHQEVLDDLNRFSLITARETITYEALLKAGINRNTHLIPDSAFVLKSEELPLPNGFIKDKTIGLNVSNLVQTYDNEENITLDNYRNLIEYLIDSSDYQVALIPHVIQSHNDDLGALTILYNEYKDTNRVILVPEYNASQMKGFISRCKIFIGARTHSTIAAYSSMVPTLVLGYSVKSRGIAKDLFGSYKNYVLPVQSLKNKDDLKNAFLWIEKNYEKIKKHLEEIMPDYMKRCYELEKAINDIKIKAKPLKGLASKEKCSGCSACANVCPTNCIEMVADNEGFLYPATDYNKCINCELCRNICPANNEYKPSAVIQAYAAKNKNIDIRLSSSSGGIFSALAEKTLLNKGVVYGAAFNEDNEVFHIEIKNKKDLAKLRGSKYVQSNIDLIYKSIKSNLINKVEVLFSGTPCQIQGLYAFLGRDYSNLITVEVICHGTPSPAVFKKYKEELEKVFNSKITSINFRAKENGWKKFNNTYVFKNGKTLTEGLHENIYMEGFLKNLYLRPSCHNCPANNYRSGSDLALADFWGIENVVDGFDDDKGSSLVIIKSIKAKKSIESLKEVFDLVEVNIENVVQYNSCIVSSVAPHKSREQFFANYQDANISDLIRDNLE